jgi:dihydrofolate reductase
MRKVVLYIAMSMNGFIARRDGKLDWLTSIRNPSEGDYGYMDLLQNIDTIIMGRKTYEELIKMGIE